MRTRRCGSGTESAAGPRGPARGLGSLAGLAVTACLLATGPDWVVEPGYIGLSGWMTDVITAPDTVDAGTSFTAVVLTFGSSSCTRPAGARVDLSSLRANVVPLDSVLRGKNVICTTDLAAFHHPVSLRFAIPGQGTIAVTGRGDRGDTTLTRSVVVR